MADHRVPLLGDAWRRFEEPETSRDPRIRALVSQLSNVALAPAPAPDFRAELRAQLVAITPRIVAESLAENAAMVEIVPRKVAAQTASAPVVIRRRISFGRVVGIAACVLTAFALLLGGALSASRHAVPGDTLYGLKRAAERFQLATDSNDTDRASDLLDFAGTRADEAHQLLARSTAAADPHTVSLVSSTLGSADSDVREASRLLSGKAVADGSAGPLAVIRQWAPTQQQRLTAIWKLPTTQKTSSLKTLTLSAKSLVSAVSARANSLIPSVASTCGAGTTTDQLGALPCSTSPRTGNKVVPTPTRHTTTPPRVTAPVHTGSPVHNGPSTPVVVRPRTPLGSVTPPKSSAPLLTIPSSLPTGGVPLPKQSGPILGVNSSGACVNLLGIKLNLGGCPSP